MTPTRLNRIVGMACVLAAITTWGAYFPYAKVLLDKLSPITFLVFRFGIGATVLTLIALRRRSSLWVERRDVPAVFAAAAVGIIIHQLLQVHGLTHTSATNTGWILTLIPPVTGLLGWVFLRERITIPQAAGLGVAMIGLVLFVSRWAPTTLSITGNRGDALAFGSVLTWSIYTVTVKSALRRYAPLPMTALHMTIGFSFFLFAGIPGIIREIATLTGGEWVILVAIGIIPSGLAYYWWNAGLKRLTVVNTSTFLFIEAIVASVAGHLVLGERFTPPMALAALLVVVGVALTQRTRR